MFNIISTSKSFFCTLLELLRVIFEYVIGLVELIIPYRTETSFCRIKTYGKLYVINNDKQNPDNSFILIKSYDFEERKIINASFNKMYDFQAALPTYLQ